MLDALRSEGCKILHEPPANVAPFRITFETPAGERMGILAYAFTANSKRTRNRPEDEHRFQMKYGSGRVNGGGRLHDLWQDPYGLYTTLLVGIDVERGIFVGADPVLHNPTKLFISVEFKRSYVVRLQSDGWYAWERPRRYQDPIDAESFEVLVGGRRESFLRYIRFEREALGEDQGHRQLLAERASPSAAPDEALVLPGSSGTVTEDTRVHALAREFEMTPDEVLTLIATASRLKMAVRGWVAEEHLVRRLQSVPGVSECQRLEGEGQPDVRLRIEGSRPITIECKNVGRGLDRDGRPKIDFMRSRTSQGDKCSRYYSPRDFDVVAACLHAVTLNWEYRFVLPGLLDPHKECDGKLSNLVRVDQRWQEDAAEVLRTAARGDAAGVGAT